MPSMNEGDPLLGGQRSTRTASSPPKQPKESGPVRRWPLKGSVDGNIITVCCVAYAAAGIILAFFRPWVLALGGSGASATEYQFALLRFTTTNARGSQTESYRDVDCGRCVAAGIVGVACLGGAAVLLGVALILFLLKALRYIRAKGSLLPLVFTGCGSLTLAASVTWISVCRPHLEGLVSLKYRGDTLGEPIALLPASTGFCVIAAVANSSRVVKTLSKIFDKKSMDHLGINFAVFTRVMRLLIRGHVLLAFVAVWPSIQSNVEDASNVNLDPIGAQGAPVALNYFAYVGLVLIAFGAFHWERFWRQKLERRNQLMRVAVDRQSMSTPPRGQRTAQSASFVAAALESSELSAADYTVLVQNVPTDCTSARELSAFFEGNVGPVAMTTIVPQGLSPFLCARREWDVQLRGMSLYGARASIPQGGEDTDNDTDLDDMETGSRKAASLNDDDDGGADPAIRTLRPSFGGGDDDSDDSDDSGDRARDRAGASGDVRAAARGGHRDRAGAPNPRGALGSAAAVERRKVPRRSSLSQAIEMERCLPLHPRVSHGDLVCMTAVSRERIAQLRAACNDMEMMRAAQQCPSEGVAAPSGRKVSEGDRAILEGMLGSSFAFVTFRRTLDAAKCHALFVQDSRQAFVRLVAGSKREYPRFKGVLLQVEPAPRPEDVDWESLSNGHGIGGRVLRMTAFWVASITVGFAVVWLLYLLKASKHYISPADSTDERRLWTGAGFAFFLAAPITFVHRVACWIVRTLANWAPSPSRSDRDRLRIECSVLVLGAAQAFLVPTLLGGPPADVESSGDFWWPHYFSIPFNEFQVLALATVTVKVAVHAFLAVCHPVFWMRRWLLCRSARDLAQLREMHLRPAIDMAGEVVFVLDVIMWCILYIKISATTLVLAPIALAAIFLVASWAYTHTHRRPPRSESTYHILSTSVQTLTGTGLFLCLLVSAVSGLLDVLLIDRDCERRTQAKHFSDDASRGYLALFLTLAVALGGRALHIFFERCIRPFWRMQWVVSSPWEERPPFHRLVARSGGRLHVPPLTPDLDVVQAQRLRALTVSYEFEVPWGQRRSIERL